MLDFALMQLTMRSCPAAKILRLVFCLAHMVELADTLL